MSRPQGKRTSSSRGIGRCGSPGCFEDKAPGHFLCANHLETVMRVRQTIEHELGERSIFRQRSDNPNRMTKEKQKVKAKAPRIPTCCWVGCLEPRFAGRNYCEAHLEQEEETE